MKFAPTNVNGVVVVTPDRFDDERGFFARTWDQAEFEANGLNSRLVERNLSGNRAAGTLRGMHYQRSPHAQAKLVTCLTGAVYDVAVDLRPESPTYLKWFGVELRAATGTMLYVPEGCAHGFETLEPQSTIEYLMSAVFAPNASAGVRYNDPTFDIRWPEPPTVMSDRDRTWPDYQNP